ncbi:MAG: ABC transporter ATP-binding protein [Ignavibacteriaceae bacterium]|nr:ABC transporter ATP-binding protein [Ignavibacteriaceae bacterium]
MEAELAVLNLSKSFGSLKAVDDVSFEIGRNEIFGLLGPNGAGKTTLISMICGLLKPTSGKVVFNGAGERRRVGYCPQENIYYPKLTCLEQLIFTGEMYGMSAAAARERALMLLQLLGLTDKEEARAAGLSGGMKRRLNLCLAIIHDPDLIILDEPEAGLDPQSRLLVREFIKNISARKTVILTTHNMDEADRLADRIAIVDHGKLLLLDTPENLKRTTGEGDILELIFESHTENKLQEFAGEIKKQFFKVSCTGDTLLIKNPNIINSLSGIKDAAGERGLRIAELKLRENTLEDVFIHLTGRTLRQ